MRGEREENWELQLGVRGSGGGWCSFVRINHSGSQRTHTAGPQFKGFAPSPNMLGY